MAQGTERTTARGLSNIPWHQRASSAPDTYAPCMLWSVPGCKLSSQHRQKEWGLKTGQLLHLFLCAGKQTSRPSLGGFASTSGSSVCSSADSCCLFTSYGFNKSRVCDQLHFTIRETVPCKTQLFCAFCSAISPHTTSWEEQPVPAPLPYTRAAVVAQPLGCVCVHRTG